MADKVTFTVYDSPKGKTFATLEEANAYEREHRKKTGVFVGIIAGTKPVTHICKAVATATDKPKETTPKAKPKADKPKATPKKNTCKPKATKAKPKAKTKTPAPKKKKK